MNESEQLAKKTLNTTSKRECSIESKNSHEALPDPTKQGRTRILEMSSKKNGLIGKLKDLQLWAADESVARWALVKDYCNTDKRQSELDEKDVEEPTLIQAVLNTVPISYKREREYEKPIEESKSRNMIDQVDKMRPNTMKYSDVSKYIPPYSNNQDYSPSELQKIESDYDESPSEDTNYDWQMDEPKEVIEVEEQPSPNQLIEKAEVSTFKQVDPAITTATIIEVLAAQRIKDVAILPDPALEKKNHLLRDYIGQPPFVSA